MKPLQFLSLRPSSPPHPDAAGCDATAEIPHPLLPLPPTPPPQVLALLDATVEIPQLGLIRSLNVHVSGAIALYEYTKQQLRNT